MSVKILRRSTDDATQFGTSTIDLTNVVIYRNGTRTVGPIDISVGHGEIVGLLGPNGCGKSSILKAIGGIIPQSNVGGSIRLFGSDRKPLNRIGQQPQSATVFTRMTVEEQLLLVARNRGAVKDVTTAMDCIYNNFPLLADRANVLASKLNGGMRRTLSIAMAMINLSSGILLLDEPTNDLSETASAHLREVLRQCAARDHNGIVVVSHDRSWIESTVDKVVEIDGQGLVTAAPMTKDLFDRQKVITLSAESRIEPSEDLRAPVNPCDVSPIQSYRQDEKEVVANGKEHSLHVWNVSNGSEVIMRTNVPEQATQNNDFSANGGSLTVIVKANVHVSWCLAESELFTCDNSQPLLVHEDTVNVPIRDAAISEVSFFVNEQRPGVEVDTDSWNVSCWNTGVEPSIVFSSIAIAQSSDIVEANEHICLEKASTCNSRTLVPKRINSEI